MLLDNSGSPWFAISEFQQQAYCEVQLKYKWAGIKIVTPKMAKGTEIHNQLLEKFKKETKDLEEITVWDALKAASVGKTSIARELAVRSSNFKLYGVIDQIEIGPGGIVIIDDKPCEYPYYSAKVQLFLYAIAFKDFYRPEMDITVRMRHRDKGNIVWEEILTEEIFEQMTERIQRMTELVLGERDFEPTKNPKKCINCSYKDVCKHTKNK